VLWFSFSAGFLGKASGMSIQSTSRDTLFSFNPRLIGCDALKTYTLDIANSSKTENEDRYICEGFDTRFEVETGWEYTNWSSTVKGDLGKTNPLIYTTTNEPDVVRITVTNDQGCKIVRKVAITVSKPIIQVQPDKVKILKETSVQLSATGADRYAWTPATGLDKSDVDNPVATPLASLRYTVTGYDSIGCSDQADVMIIVEGSSFIPNLFTPNDDGTNDELKILGLPSVKILLFSLYNREGSLVFKTHDFAEITQRGWDGTTGGIKQPAGIYFWKIEGSTQTGERILLNGKEKGSVFLVR
jgi:gliding motility-associated-like protein